MAETKKRFNRVLLKLSGEAIAKKYTDDEGKERIDEIFDPEILVKIADVIKRLVEDGIEVGIVIGGGNIWRGAYGKGVKRARADQMGMLATTINSLALCDTLEQLGVKATVMTSLVMPQVADIFTKREAVKNLSEGKVVIFGCGTGNPFFSTDTTAALRAAEIDAEVILLAKKVDAVYDSDPNKNPNAVKFDKLSYIDVLNRGLGVMDSTATSLCMDNKIPILVFGLNDPENIIRAVQGEEIGTIVE